MVVLEAIGIASKEIFDYNRENFKFDQEQRLQKDLSRVEMQIKRFDLFRQDIEDLVKLTVDKMDMYHLIGALFLGFTTTIYCEGRVQNPPVWFNGLYLLSVASSFVYLLLAVWLSMHASISSHSFGVRLRTRYVRLPIPSLSEITSLTAKLSDFENQGVREVMRVPFAPKAQQWSRPGQDARALGSDAVAAPNLQPGHRANGPEDQLGHGEDGFCPEDVVMTSAQALPGKHIHLFRRLQAKWQSYDAYARVAMAMGVHQMLNALNYYMVGVNLVQWKCPSIAYGCTLIFQSGTLAIGLLDVSGWSKLGVSLLQAMGSAPIVIILVILTLNNHGRGPKDEIILEPGSWAAFAAAVAYLVQGTWLWMLLILAKPSNDEAGLPRRYRAVLFLDVFGDAAYDPTEAEHAPVLPINKANKATVAKATQGDVQRHMAALAENALSTAQAALRRWEAVPQELLSGPQRDIVAVQRREYTFWRRTFHGHLTTRQQPSYDTFSRDKHDLRSWAELSAVERQEDEFAEALLGPLDQPRGTDLGSSSAASTCFYDLENGEQIWEQVIDQRVLTLQELSHLVRKAASSVRALLKKAEGSSGDLARVVTDTSAASDDEDDEDGDDEEESESSTDSENESKSGKRSVTLTSPGKGKAKDSLPWKIVRRMTKTLSICWLALGFEQIGEELMKGGKPSKLPGHEGHESHESHGSHESQGDSHERRLSGNATVLAEPHFIQWPHGAFFSPTSLSCLMGQADGDGKLIVGSRYRLYEDNRQSGPLSALPMKEFPPSAVALCAAGREACLLGAATEAGIALWPWGSSPSGDDAVVLPVQGLPWQSLTGAVVQCKEAAPLLPQGISATWCLLLSGWDGEHALVAAAPLPHGPARPPQRKRLVPRLDVPLSLQPVACRDGEDVCPAAADAPLLSFEGRDGRLWVLHSSSGMLEAWDLFSFQQRGKWRLQWQQARDFRATAFCGDSQAGLLVTGTDELSGPRLFRIQGLLSDLHTDRE